MKEARQKHWRVLRVNVPVVGQTGQLAKIELHEVDRPLELWS